MPVDLVRQIMETAAHMEPQFALSLALVSRVVNGWITPMIYHTVVFEELPQSMGDIDDFARILRAPRANGSIGATVRRLVLLNILWDGAVLLECHNLETLVTDSDLPLCPDVYLTSRWPAPSYILLVSHTRYQLNTVGHPLLRNITHLYVDYPSAHTLRSIAHLRYLTHLGIGCWGNVEDRESCPVYVAAALSQPSIISVVVYAFEKYEGQSVQELIGQPWVELAAIKDERLLAGPGFSHDDHIFFVKSRNFSIWKYAAAHYRNWRQQVLPEQEQ